MSIATICMIITFIIEIKLHPTMGTVTRVTTRMIQKKIVMKMRFKRKKRIWRLEIVIQTKV